MSTVRPPAVAGMFYPADPQQLGSEVLGLLAAASPQALHPKALIVPHAGYVYSGAVAASAYATLKDIAPQIRRVVLLGPAHRVAVRGLALPDTEAFDTPLGRITLDLAAMRAIAFLPQVSTSSEAHAFEHSLEVQLPFLQSVLGDFTLVPLAVGMATAQEVAEVLEAVWGGPETLIVISSDLSHYLPYTAAQLADAKTADDIVQLRQLVDHEQACGSIPISGMIVAAHKHGLVPHLLDLRNSGDTAGSHLKVVGYAAFAFTRASVADQKEYRSVSNEERGKILLPIARAAIARALNLLHSADETAPWLEEHGACFVTLTQHGELHGCIGTLQAHRSLLSDIKSNAVSAAFRDPRFAPLTAEEFDSICIEISLLSAIEPMTIRNEEDAIAQLRPGIDGVIFEYGLQYRSTFLPQVWKELPEPHQFMAHLKRKAGLPDNFWAEGVKLTRYTVTKWREAEEQHG